mmetsp:Transcript_43188/g.69512  ORF Transcript_43188/g.69512 Transcript_43188/m.69512 type:complete len:193 (-) Transcript_43188:884-1462(-)
MMLSSARPSVSASSASGGGGLGARNKSGGVGRARASVGTTRVSGVTRVVVAAAGPDPIPAAVASKMAEGTKTSKNKGFRETMGFASWAPEVINGRVAQLAFVAGVGAELATGETLPVQFHDHIFSVVFVSTLVTLASFIPGIQARRYTAEPRSKGAFGPFSPKKEMMHGRLAMVGLAAALYLEQSGAPLFLR